jgi:hypothetical protein
MGCGGSKTKQPLPISIVPVSNTTTTTTPQINDSNAQSNNTDVENQTTAKIAVAAEWTPQVLTGEKYKEAWKLLQSIEQQALEANFITFKSKVEQLQGALTDWLFDEKNWDEDGFVLSAMRDEEHAASREPVLQMFRKIRSTEAIAVMEMVDTFVARLYSEIEGTPGPVTNTTTEGEDVYQNVPEMFEGKDGFTDFKFTECSEEVQNVFKEAALLIKNGYEPCGPGDDFGVNVLKTSEKYNSVSYCTYLIAQGIVIQEECHQEVAKTVANVPNVTFRPAPHKKWIRLDGKAEEYKHEGVPKPAYRAIKDGVRCSVICNDHASLINAHNALLASPLFEGKITKDRREERSCRDVLQVVLFKGFLCEVQFHFKNTLPLKVFSHAAYNIKRPEDINLTGLETIFKFPQQVDQKRSRDEVSCKLHL